MDIRNQVTIYCDNRLTLLSEVRRDIEAGLCEIVKEHYPECEMLMGTATAGIPHAAIMSDKLDLPMDTYVHQLKTWPGTKLKD